MRLLLDLQAIQGESGYRGIGRYSQSLAKALLAEGAKRQHDVHVLLRRLSDSDLVEREAQIVQLLPDANVHYVKLPVGTAEERLVDRTLKEEAVKIRDEAVKSIAPDVFHICSVMEGYLDDVIGDLFTNDGQAKRIVNSATIYDLIPYAMPELYLADNRYKAFYLRQLEKLKKADALLAISEFTKQQARHCLGLDASKIKAIGGGVPDAFLSTGKGGGNVELLSGLRIEKNFVLYVPGGFDPRKNFERLIEAFASMPHDLRQRYQLVIASKLPAGVEYSLLGMARTHGLHDNALVLTDYVADETLEQLYRRCTVMVFPSLMEGLGLPVLEAMSCGSPVVASNSSSLPEVLGDASGLFDPTCPDDICRVLTETLKSPAILEDLKARSAKQAALWTWRGAAGKALDHIESVV
jgi:glycosyltransferase involved in cell wall biosynthesis